MFVALATFSFGQLAGSGHDFDLAAWNVEAGVSNRACGPCHTPHKAVVASSVAPLWSHNAQAAGTYTTYTSGSFDAASIASMDLTVGNSLLCLGCHDGTLDLSDHTGGDVTAAQLMGGIGTGSADLSNDLTTNHPIGFDYTTALAGADATLLDPASTNSGLGGFITADLLFTNKMECASCHDPHNGGNLGDMLRISNTTSGLCTTCHDK